MESTATCGLSRWITAAALSTLGIPKSGVAWMTCRWRFDSEYVFVDHADRAYAGGGEVKQNRRAEPAGADDQHACAAKRRLPGPTHLGQYDVARIAFKFVGAEHDF